MNNNYEDIKSLLNLAIYLYIYIYIYIELSLSVFRVISDRCSLGFILNFCGYNFNFRHY